MASSLLRVGARVARTAPPRHAARRFASVDVTIREALNMAMDEEMEAGCESVASGLHRP